MAVACALRVSIHLMRSRLSSNHSRAALSQSFDVYHQTPGRSLSSGALERLNRGRADARGMLQPQPFSDSVETLAKSVRILRPVLRPFFKRVQDQLFQSNRYACNKLAG